MRTPYGVAWRCVLGVCLIVILLCGIPQSAGATKPSGQLNYALHFTIAPTFFDAAETTGISSFLFLYALHDALVKPMPGTHQAPSLAESWSESSDGLTYEFTLRRGVTFHNGDALTAADVKFSFERYRGVSASLFRDKVKAFDIVDPYRVRIQMHEPWPDFFTFYTSMAASAGWIVPKKYIEQVGEDGFKKHPIFYSGPYEDLRFKQ